MLPRTLLPLDTQTHLAKLLSFEKAALNDAQIEFIKARREYLTAEELARYGLQEVEKPETPQTSADPNDMSLLTKVQLIEKAEALGIKTDARMNKTTIIELINGANLADEETTPFAAGGEEVAPQ